MLLDERLPIDFRHCISGHDAHSAEWAGFKGCKNGELLRLAEASGYDVWLLISQQSCRATCFRDGNGIRRKNAGYTVLITI